MTQQLEEKVQEQIDKLSERMIERRSELKYSQTLVSKITGLTQAQVSNTEHLSRNVGIDTLLKHITALGLEIQLVPKNS